MASYSDTENLKTRLRDRTYREAVRLIEKTNRCAVIRPTGFGKTGILTRFISDGQYKNILYLYPSKPVKDAVIHFYYGHNDVDTIPGVTFMTYQKVATMSAKERESKHSSYDLIIADECHKLGGNKTSHGMSRLLEKNKDVHFVGATATPERLDLIDEIGLFFDDNTCFDYTLHNAFQDNIIKKPYYCFCSYKGVTQEVEAEARLEIKNLADKDRPAALKLLKSRLIEISKLEGMGNIIRQNIMSSIGEQDYMRFIVFFPDFKSTHDKEQVLVDWFHEAFPTKKIQTMFVTSEKKEYKENADKLADMPVIPGTIDLILSCDILDMGYHVDNLTGIVMYRGTTSNIIYSQQLGRCLSTGSNTPGIVFDVVDNIHREGLYAVLGRTPAKVLKRKHRYEELKTKEAVGRDLTPEEKDELKELSYSFDEEIRGRYKKSYIGCSSLIPEDLVATSYDATYKELIAKTVAEPRSMLCRQIWKAWIDKGGNPVGKTRQDIININPKKEVPLTPFCHAKKQSIEAVLDEMGVVDEIMHPEKKIG